jgi:D-psicose/D-tagatose/L-ribulose 3-epimerase
MNTLGIHAFVWTGGSTRSEIERAIANSAELGYRLIEFPRLDPTQVDIGWLAGRLKEAGLEVVVTMGLPFSGDIASEDAEAVARGEKILEAAVSVTRDLGGRKLGGIIYSAHGKYLTMPTAAGRRNSIECIRRVDEKARAAGVTLNLEIVNRFESSLLNTTAQGLRYLDEVGSDNVFLHLDAFHMQIEEADPAQAIHLAGRRLGYMHIGESNRGYLGAGTVNFDRIFDALVATGYSDAITFESFSSEVVDQDLSIVAGIWRNTWTDNVDLARHAHQFITMRYDEAVRRVSANRA